MLTVGTCCALASEGVQTQISEGLQVVIGVVWVLAAIGKARALAAERHDTLRQLFGAPQWTVKLVAPLLAPIELFLGIMLIARWHARL